MSLHLPTSSDPTSNHINGVYCDSFASITFCTFDLERTLKCSDHIVLIMSSRPDVLPPSKTYKPKDSNPSASTSNGFDMLDARLDHLRDTIFPPAPYVLTVPTKLPFNLSGEQVEDWVEGTPFAPKEAHLQYMSFRKDWDNGLITPIGGMLDDKGELIDEEKEKEKEKEKRKSAAGTPKVGAKKISLAEYKQQRKPGASLTNGTNGIPKINGEAKADKTIGSVTETSSKTIGLKRYAKNFSS